MGFKNMWQGMQSGNLEALAAIVLGGVRHTKEGRKLSVEDLLEKMSEHCEEGGELNPIMRTTYEAVFRSGVLGRRPDEKLLKRLLGNGQPEEEEAIVPQ